MQRITAIFLMIVMVCHLPEVTPCSFPKRDQSQPCIINTCVNGDCQQSIQEGAYGVSLVTFCECDEGWGGSQCDVCCDLPCVQGQGQCIVLEQTGDTHCACSDGYDGELCSIVIVAVDEGVTTESSSHETSIILGDDENRFVTDAFTATSAGITEGLPVQPSGIPCGEGPPCVNGVCDTFVDGTHGLQIRCTCADGWTGPGCDVSSGCSLPCVQGICHVNDTLGAMWCECFADFTGDLCEANLRSIINMNTTTSVPYTTSSTSGFMTDSTAPSATCNNHSIDIRPDDCFGLDCYHGDCVTTSQTSGPDGTSITFNCVCHPGGWSGQSCDVCCDLDCNEGLCVLYDNSSMYCDCFNKTSDPFTNCSQPKITNVPTLAPVETPGWPVLGPVVAVVLGLGLLPVILAWYLWRKRNIFIMKVVYFFQKYENADVDGRSHDVFLSYLSLDGEQCEDETFVFRNLQPKLEREMHFDVYVHYKDTMPGQCKAVNILQAIESCRRTILVISPEYLAADWPRFELQKAQYETLKLRHMIVPIILRDVSEARASEETGDLFRHILDSVPCLEWPGTENEKEEAKFWKRLKLSMPKKKDSQSARSETHGV